MSTENRFANESTDLLVERMRRLVDANESPSNELMTAVANRLDGLYYNSTTGAANEARLVALTEVHEFYEFDAKDEEHFDTWLHERIKELRAARRAGGSIQGAET